MLEAQDENVERLTWSVIRALSEQAEYIASLTAELSTSISAEQLRSRAREAEQRAAIIRRLVTRGTENNKPE